MIEMLSKQEKETIAFGIAIVGSLCVLITLAWLGGHAIITLFLGT